MPDVTASIHPGDVRLWVAIDQHKFSVVAATLPPSGGQPELHRIETTERAIRRFIDRLGGPEGLAVCYEAGPGGFGLLRLLRRLGVACDVVAPSLIPVGAGDRVKTDRRDAKKLVRLYRAGELSFVQAPTPETEGLRDLLRCRDDLRCARTAARHRVSNQLLRHGRIYREGKTQWTKMHRVWIARQRLDDELAHAALCQMLVHLDGLDRQIAALDSELERIAQSERWQAQVAPPPPPTRPRARTRRARLASADPPASPLPAPHRPRQTLDCRDRRGRPRTRRLPVGSDDR